MVAGRERHGRERGEWEDMKGLAFCGWHMRGLHVVGRKSFPKFLTTTTWWVLQLAIFGSGSACVEILSPASPCPFFLHFLETCPGDHHGCGTDILSDSSKSSGSSRPNIHWEQNASPISVPLPHGAEDMATTDAGTNARVSVLNRESLLPCPPPHPLHIAHPPTR